MKHLKLPINCSSHFCLHFHSPIIENLVLYPDTVQNSDGGYYIFQISSQSFSNKNCHNSRTSNDFEMKLRPVTKYDNRNRPIIQKSNHDVILINYNVLCHCYFLWVMGNLDPFESWIPHEQSEKFTISSIVNFYFTKTENRTQKSLT